MIRRPLIVPVACVVLLAACQLASAPLFPIGAETTTGIPAKPGQAVYIGLVDLHNSQDRPMTLIWLSIPGLPPDVQADPLVLDRGATGGGGIGALREGSDWGDLSPEMLQPLKGFILEPDATDQVVVRLIAPPETTAFQFPKVNLTFGIEGGSQWTQEFPNGADVWYCVSAPDDCPKPSAFPTLFPPAPSHGTTQPAR
jgi:hypothetical protein